MSLTSLEPLRAVTTPTTSIPPPTISTTTRQTLSDPAAPFATTNTTLLTLFRVLPLEFQDHQLDSVLACSRSVRWVVRNKSDSRYICLLSLVACFFNLNDIPFLFTSRRHESERRPATNENRIGENLISSTFSLINRHSVFDRL